MSYQQTYYQKNKQRILEQHKEYRERNKDEVLERAKVYYQKNKDQILLEYQLNKEERLEYQKQYNRQHKSEYNNYQAEYFRNRRKNDPEYAKKRMIYQERYYAKKYKQQMIDRLEKRLQRITQKQIEKTKYLKNKMLRQLLKTVDEWHPPEPIEEPKKIELPFSGFRITQKGFILDF